MNNVKKLSKRAIDIFTKEMVNKYRNNVKNIILFGSYARNKGTVNSDIDILLLWKGKKKMGWDSSEEIAYEILLKMGMYISLKVLTPTEYKNFKKNNDGLISNIDREGIKLA